MAGFDNEVMYANNVDFTGSAVVTGQVTTNGQLLIGATASPNIRVGNLTSTSGSLTITNGAGTINLEVAAASTAITTLTPDVGAAIAPTAGNINVLGYDTSASQSIMDTHNVGSSTMRVENRAWLTPLVVDPTATIGNRGTYQTLTAALAAVSSGQTIYLRPGTYTENVTVSTACTIASMQGNGFQGAAIVAGTITVSAAITVTLSGLRLQTNSVPLLTVSGSAATIVNLTDCFLNVTNNTGISYTTSSSSSEINLMYCSGNITTTGIGYFASTSAGRITMFGCRFINTGLSVTANTISAGELVIEETRFNAPITSSATASLSGRNSIIFNGATNATGLTIGGNGSANTFVFCRVLSGTASAISVSDATSLFNCNIGSNNTNATVGAGTIHFSGVSYTDNSASTVTTQRVDTFHPGAQRVALPAGDYTVLNGDMFVGATSSAARAIALPAAASTGETHTIADITGTAAANNITITGSAGNIDGAATKVINVNYGSVTVVWTGTIWKII